MECPLDALSSMSEGTCATCSAENCDPDADPSNCPVCITRSDCAKGYYLSGDASECRICPASLSTGGVNCVACELAEVSVSLSENAVCTETSACPSGQYLSDITGTNLCAECTSCAESEYASVGCQGAFKYVESNGWVEIAE